MAEYAADLLSPAQVRRDGVFAPEAVEHLVRKVRSGRPLGVKDDMALVKMMEHHYADRLRYAVAGTANLLEHDQGFFVKHGDGAADVKPIAHLYKSQVYQLAAYLGVPEEIRSRRPTTDTYPLEQSQEEFYFGLSLEQTDLCLYARDHDLSPEVAAEAVGLTPEQVARAYRSIDAKRAAARYLHEPAVLIEPCRWEVR